MRTINNLIFGKNFYIIIGNNGNHTRHNRIWQVCNNGYDMKIVAINQLRKYIAEDGDMKYGLKPSKIVTPEELRKIIESEEIVNFMDCFDIYQ